jgi:hypothetical protein
MSSFESAILQTEKALKHKKNYRKKNLETTKVTKENDKREYKDKVKKSQIINEEAKGKEACLNKTLHKVKSTKEESMNSKKKIKVNPNKSHKESVNTLNIKDTSSIQPQPLPDKVSSDNDFACTNLKRHSKIPQVLQTILLLANKRL